MSNDPLSVIVLLLMGCTLAEQTFCRSIHHAKPEPSLRTWEYAVEESQASGERAGSADRLTGNVYALAIFISTPGNPWKYQDKLNVYQRQMEAQKWLVEQAKRYGVQLKFQGGNFGFSGQDVSVSSIPSSDDKGTGMYAHWASDLLKLIGYKSPLDLWFQVQRKTNCTNLHVMVYSNSRGVAYSVKYKPGESVNDYFIELSFMHRYHTSGADLYPSRIAHEVLHLYGAWDLYNSYNHRRDVEVKARQYFPNDIMYRTSYNLAELQIDALTAWRIGWGSKSEAWYDWFNPDS